MINNYSADFFNIRAMILESRSYFAHRTKTKDYMDLAFLAYIFITNEQFKSFLINDVIKEDNILSDYEELVSNVKDYIDNYDHNLSDINFLNEKTRMYNEYIVYLLVQVKLMPESKTTFYCVLSAFSEFNDGFFHNWLEQHGITKQYISEIYTSNNIDSILPPILSKFEPRDIDNNDENKKTYIQLIDDMKSDIREQNTLSAEEIVNKFTTDITDFPIKYNVYNRKHILKNIEESLIRDKKHNALLIGKSGVGKDILCRSFAHYLKEEATVLKGCRLLYLDYNLFSEGVLYRNQIEKKVNKFISCLNASTDILYIEDINLLCGNKIDTEIATILIPALYNSNIKYIASVDYAGLQSLEDLVNTNKFFEKIDVAEPNKEETKKIIIGNQKTIESEYKVKFDKKCVDIAIAIADKYIFNKCFPYKAEELFHVVGSKAAVAGKNIITDKDFLSFYSEYSKIPLENIELSDIINLDKITNKLKQEVIGQDEAITKIMEHVAIGKAGLRENDKTICNIFLKGMSGVGKTLLCQKLADALNVKLVRFDMSEYSERHSVSKLLGTPPGYIGFSDANHGSLLLTALEENPRCVLLLDEIEKANESIHNVLLQAMDNGKLTSSSGKEVSLRNVILIMTSNVGATAGNSIGFSELKDKSDSEMEISFRPEFRTRIDDIITMNGLDKIDIKKVILIEVDKLNLMLKKYKAKVKLDKKAIAYIEDKVKSNNLGLRIIKSILGEIKPQIIRQLYKKKNMVVQVNKDNLEVV